MFPFLIISTAQTFSEPVLSNTVSEKVKMCLWITSICLSYISSSLWRFVHFPLVPLHLFQTLLVLLFLSPPLTSLYALTYFPIHTLYVLLWHYFPLPNSQLPESNSSLPSHELPFLSIICLANKQLLFFLCCVSFSQVFCIFSCFPTPVQHIHFCHQFQRWGSPGGVEALITAGEGGGGLQAYKHLRNCTQ